MMPSLKMLRASAFFVYTFLSTLSSGLIMNSTNPVRRSTCHVSAFHQLTPFPDLYNPSDGSLVVLSHGLKLA
jgi:hypothetical protein